MNPSDDNKQRELRLRAEAERHIDDTQHVRDPLAAEPPAPRLDDLLHELEVHQVELEMQNEALRQNQTELEAARDRYVDLYEFAPVGYLTLTAEGMIEELNLIATTLLGKERKDLLHRGFSTFVKAEDQARWLQLFHNVIKRDGKCTAELALLRGDSTVFEAQLDGLRTAGETRRVRVVLSDVSERKRLESELADKERHLAALIATTPVGVYETDAVGKCIFVNMRWSEITGLSAKMAMNDGWSDALHPEDKDKVTAEWAASVAESRPFNLEYRFLSPNGKITWVLAQSDKLLSETGNLQGHIGTITDITERKLLEQSLAQRQLELQDLYRTLQTLREDERTRIARELHDGTGHLLTAMLMDLAWVDAKLPKDGSPVSSKLASAVTLSEQVVDSIRGVMEDLSPSILGELGLVAALEGFVDKFTTRTGIPCDLVTNGEQLKVGDVFATDLFRIVQEALNNVVKHSRATHATVSLTRNEDKTVLVIQDDGKGLEQIVKDGRGHFGIRGMRERVSMLGGTFAVTSEHGQGVRLEAVIPTMQTMHVA